MSPATRASKPGSVRLDVNLDAFSEALFSLARRPASSLLNAFVFAVSLALPALILDLTRDLDGIVDAFQGGARINLYISSDVTEEELFAVSESLLSNPSIDAVGVLTAAQALAEFARSSGLEGEFLENLGANPLPATLVVTPAGLSDTQFDSLLAELQQDQRFNGVQSDQEWIQGVRLLRSGVQRVGLALLAAIVLALLVSTSNTIRLFVESRREEIAIYKLFGASNVYIVRPFLYTGALLGLAGGLLASLLLMLANTVFNHFFTDFIQQFGDLSVSFSPGFVNMLLIMFVGTLTGVLGAGFAATYQVNRIRL